MTTDGAQRILTALVTARALLRQSRRLHPGRTHKASSAESILRHVLRRRGWTAAFRRGELTDAERLELLDDIRQYAREWMRHEAEVLFKAHGKRPEEKEAEVDAQQRTGTQGTEATAEPAAAETGENHGYLLRGADQGGGEVNALHGRVQPEYTGGRSLREGDEGNPPSLVPEGVDRALGQALAHHVRRFFTRAKSFVHEAIVAGAMALGGPSPLTAHDLAEADRQAVVQAQYLDRFHADAHFRTPAEIAEGEPPVEPMSAAQFVARAESYGGSVWGASINHDRQRKIRSGKFNQERRIHLRPKSQDHPCQTCEAESQKGWVPIGTLLEIGDSECLGIMCDCIYEYRMEA